MITLTLIVLSVSIFVIFLQILRINKILNHLIEMAIEKDEFNDMTDEFSNLYDKVNDLNNDFREMKFKN